MWAYLGKRVAAALLTALLSALAVFCVLHAVPGDVVAQMLGQAGAAGDGSEQALRAYFGLDRPLHEQFVDWLLRSLQGDLGASWTQGGEVSALIGDAFAVTLELGVLTLLLATLVGVPLGMLAAAQQGRPLDAAIQAFNTAGLAAPVFWIGLMLLIGASLYLNWAPPLVYSGIAENWQENLASMLLPVLSLGLLQAAAYSAFTRQAMVAALNEDYVRLARSKGLSPLRVYGKHVLRNVLIPLVTFMGMILIQVLGGVVVIETVFALPGLGRLIVTSLQQRDYPVVQGALLLVVGVAIAVNLAIDLLYYAIDPRLRSAR